MKKETLDALVKQFETRDFIKDDPIQIPHRFTNAKDIEIAAFISALFAYGNRKAFIAKLDFLFNLMNNKPYEFIKEYRNRDFQGIKYRFASADDVKEVLRILSLLYRTSSLKELFASEYERNNSVIGMLDGVINYFYENADRKIVSHGFYHLLPSPSNQGAMKRMNMFMRWVVRKSCVDFGLWDFIQKSELLIPLDVHSGRTAREMGLLKRKANDFKAVMELTSNLKDLDAEDPVKYDFALFGYGVSRK
ncbi:MAG: TIGR02757 family protein [Alphaproteobacteria bacterium]|nr:TIGR02757 family protein [Alphaproteobacteria bacterium]MCL2504987.1 TIGR02757 family protein [Alphaproteobacteria bacterium]